MITISGNISINNPTPSQISSILKGVSVANPLFFKLQRINRRASYAVPEFFVYGHYDKFHHILSLPRGVYERAITFFPDAPIADSTASPSLPDSWIPRLTLRDYQKDPYAKLIKALTSRRYGLGFFSTGYGKTYLSLKVIADLKTTALIVTPLKNLSSQFATDIQKLTGQKPGTLKSPKPITVTTIQGLQSALKKNPKLTLDFGFLVVDEAHLFVSHARMKALMAVNCRYSLALTGTPMRSDDDGRTDAIQIIHGPILAEGKLPQKLPTVEQRYTGASIAMSEYYGDMVEDMVTNLGRTTKIAEEAITLANQGRRVLILTKRIKHAKDFEDLIPGAIRVASDTSSATKRAELLDKLRSGGIDFQVLVGTSALLSTGVDIPSLDTLILAGDFKSNVVLQQAGGRILRLFDKKKDPVIIDYVDELNPIFLSQAKKRRSAYRKLQWI